MSEQLVKDVQALVNENEALKEKIGAMQVTIELMAEQIMRQNREDSEAVENHQAKEMKATIERYLERRGISAPNQSIERVDSLEIPRLNLSITEADIELLHKRDAVRLKNVCFTEQYKLDQLFDRRERELLLCLTIGKEKVYKVGRLVQIAHDVVNKKYTAAFELK
ncbi:hypothetical protein P8864_10415 [Priestia flexa]|uniref:hypothetical protein n=1 Tax=Priestia flexa TaxID=86664 RepID=UPI000C24DD44|nr:hypothetical protein [Priestia flexa]MEC0666302.1 hypothetical protein [Priestia flexa]